MATLTNLSTAKLNKIIDDARADLTRSKNIDATTVDVKSCTARAWFGYHTVLHAMQ